MHCKVFTRNLRDKVASRKKTSVQSIVMEFLLRPVGEDHKDHIVTILPKPGFVIKSKLATIQGRPNTFSELQAGFKIFINVCQDDQVPKPDIDFNPSTVYPLIMNNQWEIPIITSSVREDRDKKGASCYVWDCCVNTECMLWISRDLQLREIVVEWCLESCELSEYIEISRDDIAFPKMKKKGEVIPSLEVLSDELSNDYRKEVAKHKNERDDPTNILKMKRSLLDTEADNSLEGTNEKELPPLFPQAKWDGSSRPLIEEIDQLTIADSKKKKPKILGELQEIHYDVQIRKTKSTNDYKLKIEITSEVNSSSDLKIQYIVEENSFVLKNTNLHVCKEKTLEIPLPNIFTLENISNLKCFFTKKEKKLVIFV